MRLLLDLRHVKYGSINGVARFSSTLLDYYQADSRVEALTLILSDPKLLDAFNQHNCKIVKGSPFFPRSIITTSFLCWKLRKEIDVVHFCNYTTHIWRLPKTIEVIVTIHDLMFITCNDFYNSSRFQLLKTLYFKFLVNIAINNCSVLQTVSEYTRGNIITNFPKSKEKRILVSAPLADKSSIASNVDVSWLAESRYLVYVGSDRSHKKLSWIIEEINNQKQSNFVLFVIGANESSTGLSSNVRFLQNVSDTELQNIYRYAEANILMSIDEGYGLSVKEAASNMCITVLPMEPHFKQFDDLEIVWINRRSGLTETFAKLWDMSRDDITSQKLSVLQRYQTSIHSDEHIRSIYKGLLTHG